MMIILLLIIIIIIIIDVYIYIYIFFFFFFFGGGVLLGFQPLGGGQESRKTPKSGKTCRSSRPTRLLHFLWPGMCCACCVR